MFLMSEFLMLTVQKIFGGQDIRLGSKSGQCF